MLIKTCPTEFKFVDTGKVLGFAGYASKFNGIDAYGDMILPGAYADTLANRDRPVLMMRNHWEGVIGKWTTLAEDDQGLYVEGELTPGHSLAQDTYALLKHGAIHGLSIGYFAEDEEEGIADERRVRILKKINLVEISVVDNAADLGAKVTNVKELHQLKDIEALLRSRGFSRSEATAIVAQIKSIAHGERDAHGKAVAELLRSYKLPL